MPEIETTLNVRTGNSVLVVEDNKAIGAFLTTTLASVENVKADLCATYAEAQKHLVSDDSHYFIAILDLDLPDAPNGEIVDLVQSYDIPVVVLTGTVDEAKREAMMKQQVADYVYKHHVMGINYVVNLVDRIHYAKSHPILVVDDSSSYRAYLQALLRVHGYASLSAVDGVEGIAMLRAHPEVRLVVTDYNMPNMDGLKMCGEIRKFRTTDELAIIAVSNTQQDKVLPLFLKNGASDYLSKPFADEEFFCRVDQNVDMIHYIQDARDAANRDFLTKLYNRRYFFEHAEILYRRAKKGKIRIAVGMVDADHFKSINDTYGHQVGDDALCAIATTLKETAKTGSLLARFGGEEFVVMNVLQEGQSMNDCADKLRQAIADIDLVDRESGNKIPITVSIGCAETLDDDLDKMLNLADEALYQAKEDGRNRVVVR